MDIEEKPKRKQQEPIIEPIPNPADFPAPNTDSKKTELLALLDSAPQVPYLSIPNIDPQHVMATTFNPAYREFLIKLRRYAENV